MLGVKKELLYYGDGLTKAWMTANQALQTALVSTATVLHQRAATDATSTSKEAS